MKKVAFLILLIGILVINVGAQVTLETAICAPLEGVAEATCDSYFAKREEIRRNEALMQAVHNQTNQLMTRLNDENNATSRDWLLRAEVILIRLEDDYQRMWGQLSVFNRSEVLLLEEGIKEHANLIPDRFEQQIEADFAYFQELETQWVNVVKNDLDLLRKDMENAALAWVEANRMSETTDDNEVTLADLDDEATDMNEESDNDDSGETREAPNAVEIIDRAQEQCSHLTGEHLNACLFQEAWVDLQTADFCDGTDAELCEIARDMYSDYTEDEWDDLFNEYSALDDPLASIAVLYCQLNPAFDEEGEQVGLAACSESEYISLTSIQETTSEDIQDEDTETDTTADSDYFEPLTGAWCDPSFSECSDLWGFLLFALDETGITVYDSDGFIPRVGPNIYTGSLNVYDDVFYDITIEILSPTEIRVTITDDDGVTGVSDLIHSSRQ